MQGLNIEATSDTPKVYYDSKEGVLNVQGRSMPENSVDFYKPIITWIDNEQNLTNKKLEVNFTYKYFNTASSKMILEVMNALERLSQKGYNININWCYLKIDEDMKEDGEYFEEIVDLPFKYIGLENLAV